MESIGSNKELNIFEEYAEDQNEQINSIKKIMDDARGVILMAKEDLDKVLTAKVNNEISIEDFQTFSKYFHSVIHGNEEIVKAGEKQVDRLSESRKKVLALAEESKKLK